MGTNGHGDSEVPDHNSSEPAGSDDQVEVARKKPFYGWYIVGVMACASAVSMGMGSLNFGLFIKPMGDELGIGRAMFGWASTARQVSTSMPDQLFLLSEPAPLSAVSSTASARG